MKNRTELTLADRHEISILKNKKYSGREIARALKRSPNTISYELKHNSTNGVYDAKKAHAKATLAKKGRRFNYTKIERCPDLKAFIIEKLKAAWNPDEIAGYLKLHRKEYPWYVSKTALYAWLRTSRGERYCALLYSKRKTVKKHKPKTTRVMIPERVSIHKRFKSANERTRVGHWEGDTVVSKRGTSGGVSTLSERVSKLYIARKVSSMRPRTHSRAQRRMLRGKRVRSVTYDNGIENRDHHALGVPTFFCDPYSSWQKGGNENGNKMFRRFFPKGGDLSKVSQKKIDAKVLLINKKPRKILGYRSALEVAKARGIIK
ncbi:MAG: IS30 family transposase [bacterium]|nr:IS30 family transposase [bacterium]